MKKIVFAPPYSICNLAISPPTQEKPITMFIFSTFDRWK